MDEQDVDPIVRFSSSSIISLYSSSDNITSNEIADDTLEVVYESKNYKENVSRVSMKNGDEIHQERDSTKPFNGGNKNGSASSQSSNFAKPYRPLNNCERIKSNSKDYIGVQKSYGRSGSSNGDRNVEAARNEVGTSKFEDVLGDNSMTVTISNGEERKINLKNTKDSLDDDKELEIIAETIRTPSIIEIPKLCSTVNSFLKSTTERVANIDLADESVEVIFENTAEKEKVFTDKLSASRSPIKSCPSTHQSVQKNSSGIEKVESKSQVNFNRGSEKMDEPVSSLWTISTLPDFIPISSSTPMNLSVKRKRRRKSLDSPMYKDKKKLKGSPVANNLGSPLLLSPVGASRTRKRKVMCRGKTNESDIEAIETLGDDGNLSKSKVQGPSVKCSKLRGRTPVRRPAKMLNRQTSKISNLNVNVQTTSQIGATQLREVIVDGANVAYRYSLRGNRRDFDTKGVLLVYQYFAKRGHKVCVVFTDTLSNRLSNDPVMSEIFKANAVVFTPHVNQPKFNNFVLNDDRFIVQLASEKQGVIVTSDFYRDVIQYAEENKLQDWLVTMTSRLLVPTFATDTVLFDPLPHGLAGPPFQSILRM
ncbi:hypothetical protein QYM36_000960 [Artemia franciscana]|uniref:RNase NYN domain-containing protein n=1 Tax=Artemia franciscana TaxID=6661 RepID=A0AA88IHX1_ARTSF|nr:hypothetical protein QYM36_000960 [Artemia franciscana]